MGQVTPSKEFTAFFGVLCTVWSLAQLLLAMVLMVVVIPDDMHLHQMIYPFAIFVIIVGCIALAVFPLYQLWKYVTESENEKATSVDRTKLRQVAHVLTAKLAPTDDGRVQTQVLNILYTELGERIDG